jgi:hypothetical protein
MKLSKEHILRAVNEVMGQMFYLSPDLDELGDQHLEGPPPDEGISIHFPTESGPTLQLIFEWNLLKIMTAHLTALPLEELPQDWIRQVASEASGVIWGKYITICDNEEENSLPMLDPQKADNIRDVGSAKWHFCFKAESYRLSVSLLDD